MNIYKRKIREFKKWFYKRFWRGDKIIYEGAPIYELDKDCPESLYFIAIEREGKIEPISIGTIKDYRDKKKRLWGERSEWLDNIPEKAEEESDVVYELYIFKEEYYDTYIFECILRIKINKKEKGFRNVPPLPEEKV